MISKQTTLDLNGPIISFIQQPQSVAVNHNATAKFVGIATAFFPTQDPPNTASNTGTLSYRWNAEGFGPLSDGPFQGASITGSGTTTLTITNAKSPTTNLLRFYVAVDYVPSAYSQLVGSDTGNAVNDIINSDVANLTVNPFITILSQPQNDTTAVGSGANFFVDAVISDDRFGGLSYQWQLNNENLTDSSTTNAIISGSNQPVLSIIPTPEEPDISTVRVLISNPNAPIVTSNNASLNIVDLRNILIIEGYTPKNDYSVKEVNLDNNVSFTLTDETLGSNFNTITFFAPENDLDLEIEIRASKGSDKDYSLGGQRITYSGGQGGVSLIRTTLKRNDEYAVLGISDNSGLFIYRGGNLISVVGKGGDAGSTGNGGYGGGVNNAGQNGSGRGAGIGGIKISTGELSINGIFGSNSTTNTFLIGDSKSIIPNSGRTISCPKGPYWISKGILVCANIGTTQFYNTDGTLISRSALINRGFKPGYTITSTGGKGLSTGGNGGEGATGGSGGNEGGGGGGSGYTDGSYSVLSSSSGGNTSLKSTITFKLVPPPPPLPPPPPPPPPSPSSPSPAPSRSTPTYNGIAGGVNQNAGYAPSQIYGPANGSKAVIGLGGIQRALNQGYSISSIQSWATRTGAVIGPNAKKQYGLR